MKEKSYFETFRSEIPALERCTYLNTAGSGPLPLPALHTLVDSYNRLAYFGQTNADIIADNKSRLERVRKHIAAFLNAGPQEIFFVRCIAEGVNTIAYMIDWKPGDEVIITDQENPATILPVFNLVKKGITIKKLHVSEDPKAVLKEFKDLLTDKTKLVMVCQVMHSNGIRIPVKEMAAAAHEKGTVFAVDAAQSVGAVPADMKDLDCDFFTLSGHKMLGPTGIGVLYGKEEILNQMNPIEFGGEMIDFVYEQEATWKELPWKFEAGTPNIAGAIALGAAVDYLSALGMENIHAYEQELVDYVLPKLQAIDGLTVYGPEDPSQHAGVIAFNIDGLHPHDVATALDYEGVAVRAGHHCAQPLINHLGISSAARASFYIYNTKEDCDKLVEAILATKEFFNGTL